MNASHVSRAENHMATTFEFTISCENSRARSAARLLIEAHREIARLERELSEFHPESPVRQLNESVPGTPIRFSPDGLTLLERSLNLRRVTESAFDPLIKSPLGARAPACLQIDPEEHTVTRHHSETHLGFGAIGKGYALDVVRLMIEQRGFRDFLLVAGGSSIILSGLAGPGTPWSFGWSWLKDEHGAPLGIPFQHHGGATLSLGISGTHEQGAHIRRRGLEATDPVAYPHQSVLVGTASAAEADALSTAVFAAGWDASQDFLRQFSVAPALAAVENDGSYRWNGLFQKNWGALANALAAPALLLALATAPALADDAAPAPDDGVNLDANTANPSTDQATEGGADGVDLDAMGANAFNPYAFSRGPEWIALPIFALAAVLIHLRKTRRIKMKPKAQPNASAPKITAILAIIALWTQIERATATEFEKKGAAIGALLGTTKGVKKVPGKAEGYFTGNRVVFIEGGVYQPNCSHTWAIGLDKTTGAVQNIRVIEMACPHAFPTRAASFLEQFKGIGPRNIGKLESVTTIAKATGSCLLTRDAVKHAIQGWTAARGKY